MAKDKKKGDTSAPPAPAQPTEAMTLPDPALLEDAPAPSDAGPPVDSELVQTAPLQMTPLKRQIDDATAAAILGQDVVLPPPGEGDVGDVGDAGDDELEPPGEDEPPGAHDLRAGPPCRKCLELCEPCSPACFEAAGYDPKLFEAFVADLRAQRKVRVDAAKPIDDAEIAELAAAMRKLSEPELEPAKPRAPLAPGRLLVKILPGAGKIAYGLTPDRHHEYEEGDEFEIHAHQAKALLAAGLVKDVS